MMGKCLGKFNENRANAFPHRFRKTLAIEKGAALLDFLIFVKFRASSPVRGRLRLRFFLDEFQRAATTGWG
jgi:hypothetical protein